MSDNSYFGKRLAERRKELRLTQYQIAELLGMKRPNYRPYEMGDKYPAPKYQPALAEILGISENELKAWRVIDEFGPEVVQLACRVLKQEPSPDK